MDMLALKAKTFKASHRVSEPQFEILDFGMKLHNFVMAELMPMARGSRVVPLPA
jgi:hypothetical protein